MFKITENFFNQILYINIHGPIWARKGGPGEKISPDIHPRNKCFKFQPNPFLGSLGCPVSFWTNLGSGAQK